MSFFDLFRSKWKHRKPGGKLKAIQKLDENVDRQVLISVATSDPDEEVRRAAVSKISAQDVLERVAAQDRSKLVRSQALSQIQDQRVFLKMIMNDPDIGIKLEAIQNITDAELLLQCQSNSSSVVRQAVKKRFYALLKDLFRQVEERGRQDLEADILRILQNPEIEQMVTDSNELFEFCLQSVSSSRPEIAAHLAGVLSRITKLSARMT